MARLIDADALRAEFDDIPMYGSCVQWKIDNAPTVDAVEVVRCEKCHHSQELPKNRESAFGVGVRHCRKGRGNSINPFGLSTVSRDDFCSHGERREDTLRGLALAMLAGARAIETNRRCAGATYIRDPFGENDGPLELSYYEAAKTLREEGERILDRLKEDTEQ